MALIMTEVRTKTDGTVPAVSGLSVEIDTGVLGSIGTDGAGTSTVIRSSSDCLDLGNPRRQPGPPERRR